MKRLYFMGLILISFFYLACTKQSEFSIQNTGSAQQSVTKPSTITLNGTVFKGSFIRGSLLFFYELDSSLNQTGRSFNTTIEDDYGNFSLNAQNLSGKLVRVVGDGFYWNEVLNENSSTRITLTGISRIDSNQTVNVNVLTHLERPRVEYLYSVMKYSFDSAKSQAISEVLKAFGYISTGIKSAEKVGIFGVGNDSKILLAISAMIQGYRSESEVTTLLNDIAEDLKKDGTFDNKALGNDIATHNYYLDTVSIINNVKSKFSKLYNRDTINTLNLSFISTFKATTNFVKEKDLIEFPLKDAVLNFPNILNESNTTITGSFFSPHCIISRKGMKIKVEILNEDGSQVNGYDFGFATGNGTGWIIMHPNIYYPTFTSNGTGVYSQYVQYSVKKKYRLNIYYNDFNKPSVVRYINFN